MNTPTSREKPHPIEVSWEFGRDEFAFQEGVMTVHHSLIHIDSRQP